MQRASQAIAMRRRIGAEFPATKAEGIDRYRTGSVTAGHRIYSGTVLATIMYREYFSKIEQWQVWS